MKKNLKRVSVMLMLALGTSFAMTSCGGGNEAEAEKAAEELLKGLDAAIEEAEEHKCEHGGDEGMKCEKDENGDMKCAGADTEEATEEATTEEEVTEEATTEEAAH